MAKLIWPVVAKNLCDPCELVKMKNILQKTHDPVDGQGQFLLLFESIF
jgi:hypothetical protein